MFERIKALLFRKARGISLTLKSLIMMGVGIVVVGLLYPIGLESLESYTPSDANTAIVWGLLGVFAVLSVAITYIRAAAED